MVGDVGVPLPKSLRHAVAVSQAAAPTVAESLNAATGVLTLTLSRPKSKNAFNDTLYRDLTRALQAANSNAAVRAVVLTGAGDFFTAGADLQDVSEGSSKDDPVGLFMQTAMRFPKLLVAAVNGPAVGIGSTLIPHCDVAYASSTAYFWTPFTRIAVVPEFCSSVLFPKIMGISLANEMLIMGKKLTAAEAKACGFISEVFAPEELLAEVYKRIEATLAYPLADKSLLLFKDLIKGPRLAELQSVFEREMLALTKRVEEGDTAAAVIQLLSQKRSKL